MYKLRPFIRLAVAAMLSVAVAACVARPKEAPAIRTIQPMEAVRIDATTGDVSAQNLRVDDDDGVHTVLALSAGGADGAYGAGVLTGWTADGSRPVFDVVTGVSTGALMAVLAFLGPDYDTKLEDFYTNQTNQRIYHKSNAGFLGASLYNNEPLKLQIEEFVTQDILNRVAAEHAKGRRLYVATTNLDAGDLVVWDMGEIADGGRSDDVLHFQKVLRASAAVPAFFPPVYIKPQRGIQLRQAHVDGGVKEPILLKAFMLPNNNQKKEVFLVINGNTTRLNSNTPVSGKALDIAQKSIVEMMRELQEDTTFRSYILAKDAGAAIHITQIPDSIPLSEEGLNFDTKRMRRLYQAGYNVGQSGAKRWLTRPPPDDQYDVASHSEKKR